MFNLTASGLNLISCKIVTHVSDRKKVDLFGVHEKTNSGTLTPDKELRNFHRKEFY